MHYLIRSCSLHFAHLVAIPVAALYEVVGLIGSCCSCILIKEDCKDACFPGSGLVFKEAQRVVNNRTPLQAVHIVDTILVSDAARCNLSVFSSIFTNVLEKFSVTNEQLPRVHVSLSQIRS